MSYRLVIKPEAEADLLAAYDWYETQRDGLGDEFLLKIETTYTNIQRQPRLFPLVHKEFRRALTQRFPYGIFYTVENETVFVHAVFHASRDPREWQERM